MRKGQSFTLPMDKAEEIMCSENQVIMIDNSKGEWSGLSINKADITMTERDRDKEKEYNSLKLLPQEVKPMTKEEEEKVEKIKKEINKKYNVREKQKTI